MVVNLKIPTYKVSAAASNPESASSNALKQQTEGAKNQTLRNSMGGGGAIPAPMAASSGAEPAGPNNAQSNMSGVMKGLLDAQAAQEFDNDVKKGGKKRRKSRRKKKSRKKRKKRKSRRKRKSRKKRKTRKRKKSRRKSRK